jgi:hypothetical protein
MVSCALGTRADEGENLVMKRRKRKTQANKTNATRHRRALAVGETAALAKILKHEWKDLDVVERGDLLQKLVAMGCSTRGLSEQVGQSATSIRRHLELASQSKEVRELIRKGVSKKKVLDANARRRRIQHMQDRLRVDASTGNISTALADEVIAFCKGEYGLPETPVLECDLPLFLSEVEEVLLRFERTAEPKRRISKRKSPKARLKALRPTVSEDQLWIHSHALWLAKVIWSSCSERAIWERALRKVEQRSTELRPKQRTMMDSLNARAKQMAILVRPSGRRVIGPANEIMKRQGRQTRKTK